MGGPRKDKQRAWLDIEILLEKMADAMDRARGFPRPRMFAGPRLDALHAFRMLQQSGRVDARQIVAIKKLVTAIWALARDTDEAYEIAIAARIAAAEPPPPAVTDEHP